MNYIEKLDKAIELMKEALEEAIIDRNRLAGDQLDTPLKRVFKLIRNSGIVEGKRYKTSEVLAMVNISDVEMDLLSNHIPHFGGTREIRFGKLLSFLAKYNIDGFTLKEGIINGCKSYRIERV